VDGAAPTPVSAPFALPAADGAHTVTILAADNVGNEEAPRSSTVWRDGAAPVTTLAFSAAPYASPSGPIYGAGLELSFTAADPVTGGVSAGVHHTEFTLDGGASAEYAGPFGAAEGARTLSFRSVDGVGNAEATRTVSFQVDATPPLSTLSVAGGTTLFGEDLAAAGSAVSLTATDPVSGGVASGVASLVYSVDGGADQAYTAPFVLGAGRHTISFGAVDRAGNAEQRRTAAVSPGEFLTSALTGLDGVVLSGKAAVTGSVAGLTVTLNGQAAVEGTISRGPVAAPAFDLAAARAWAEVHNGNTVIPAALLNGGALTMSGGSLELPAGDYYLTGLTLSGQSRLTVAGRVNIFLHGPLAVTGGAELNAEGATDALWIISDAGEAKAAGNSRMAFNLFAPLAEVRVSGNGAFAGRVLGRTVALAGKALQPSTAALAPSSHGPKLRMTHPAVAARAGKGTAGGGHAGGRGSALASASLDAHAPGVASRASSAESREPPSGAGPSLAAAAPKAPREAKRVNPRAAPASGPGTAGPGVASSDLARREPSRRLGGAVRPATAPPVSTAPERRTASRRVKSSMPPLALAARAAFSSVGGAGAAVRAKDRAAVVIPEGAATSGLGVTVSTPKTNDLVENRRQSSVESRKGLVAAAVGVQYGPHGTQFAKPVTLELPYDRASLPRGLSEGDLAVHYWNPVLGDWEKLESSVDAHNQVVRAQTTHFSLYRIFGGGAAAASAPSGPNDPSFSVKAAYAFPSPSRNAAPVSIRVQPGLADSVSVRVYDLSGRLVHDSSNFRQNNIDDLNGFGSQITFDHAWDVSGVGSGVYSFIVTARKAGATDIRATGKVGVIK